MENRTFYIGFSKSKKKFPIGSWLIRLYQGGSEFSHCYFRIKSSHFPSDTIIHSAEGKVQRMSGTQFDKRNEVVEEFAVTLTKEEYMDMLSQMHEVAGDDYSILQNLGIVYVDLMRVVFKKTVKNPWTTGWNCSEFTMTFLKLHFQEEFKHFDPDTITPIQVYKIMQDLKQRGLVE